MRPDGSSSARLKLVSLFAAVALSLNSANCSDTDVKAKFRQTSSAQIATEQDAASVERPRKEKPIKQQPAASQPVKTHPITEVLSKTITKEPFRLCDGKEDNKIRANVYKLPPFTRKLPESFLAMEKSGSVCMTNYAISGRNWQTGFPGLEAGFMEWFALDTYTTLNINEPGLYTFFLNSDDGAKLYLDGELVIDNDGVHGETEKTASVELTAGSYEMKIEYFQGPRYFIALELFWLEPGSNTKTYVPTEVLELNESTP